MTKNKGGVIRVILGIVIFITCTVLLFKNEGRAVNRAKALANIKDATEISSTDTSIQDGTMILIGEKVVGENQLRDDLFGVNAPKESIKLFREVSMYQWEEHSTTEDGKESYTYEKVWHDQLINSNEFSQTTYSNPTTMRYESEDYICTDVSMGDYNLSKVFINKINKKDNLSSINPSKITLKMKVSNNMIYISSNGVSTLESPEIGDYKIQYRYVPAQTITVLGEKRNTEVISYYTKNGELAEVSYGNLSKESLRQEKIEANNTTTLMIRIGLIIGIAIANAMVISPLTRLLAHVPFVGRLVNNGIALMGFLLGLSWSLLIIAVGWIVFRPLIGIGLLAVVGGILFLVIIKSRDKDLSVG